MGQNACRRVCGCVCVCVCVCDSVSRSTSVRFSVRFCRSLPENTPTTPFPSRTFAWCKLIIPCTGSCASDARRSFRRRRQLVWPAGACKQPSSVAPLCVCVCVCVCMCVCVYVCVVYVYTAFRAFPATTDTQQQHSRMACSACVCAPSCGHVRGLHATAMDALLRADLCPVWCSYNGDSGTDISKS